MSTSQGSHASDSTRVVQQPMPRRSRFLQLGVFLVIIVLCLLTGFIGQVATLAYDYPGLSTVFSLIFGLGWLLLFVWVILLLGFLVVPVVRKQQVVEEWSILIQGGNKHASEILGFTRELIVNSEAPKIAMEQKDIAPGIIRGALGDSRPFLVITNRTNANLVLYRMYLNARDYGNSLQVSWYVIRSPSILQILFRLSLFVPLLNLLILPLYFLMLLPKAGQAGILDLDFLDLQDLKAYVTNAHHCVLEAVDKLLLDLNQDPSKIERKSRGFLGIS